MFVSSPIKRIARVNLLTNCSSSLCCLNNTVKWNLLLHWIERRYRAHKTSFLFHACMDERSSLIICSSISYRLYRVRQAYMFHKNTKEKHCSYSKQYNKHPDSLRIVSDKSIYEEQFPYADQ